MPARDRELPASRRSPREYPRDCVTIARAIGGTTRAQQCRRVGPGSRNRFHRESLCAASRNAFTSLAFTGRRSDFSARGFDLHDATRGILPNGIFFPFPSIVRLSRASRGDPRLRSRDDRHAICENCTRDNSEVTYETGTYNG